MTDKLTDREMKAAKKILELFKPFPKKTQIRMMLKVVDKFGLRFEIPREKV